MERPQRNLTILGIFAHPHDCLHCMGTCAHHVADGDSVTVVILTDGGSTHNERLWKELQKPLERRDPRIVDETREQFVETKRKEVQKACSYFGIADVRVLGYPDRPIRRTDEMVGRVADLICEVRPDILITELPHELNPDPTYISPNDHTTCAAVVQEASYVAYHPHQDSTRGRHAVARSYFTAPGVPSYEVDFFVDISDQYENRVKADACYVTQGHTMAYARHRVDRSYGHYGWTAQTKYAEKFVTDRLMLVDRLPITDHDLQLASETGLDTNLRLGWYDTSETELQSG